MKCCPKCINDVWLEKEVIPYKSASHGTCSYCNSTNQPLLDPIELSNSFEILSGIYTLDNKGQTLVEWFKNDWNMFPNMDIANAKHLLSDILDDGEVVRKKFKPSSLCDSDRLHTWEQLKKELMHENRFFPKTRFNEDRLAELLSQLLIDSDDLNKIWYRARIQKDESTYPASQMSAPPAKLATAGRANPAGIPYLYIASTIETAVSEIRPHTGQLVSVAAVDITEQLKFVDLRDAKGRISPFIFGDENTVAKLRGDIGFLVKLGNELTKPVLPHAAAVDYIPSQYLCEFAKKCGYNGVIYNSSVSSGINLALFTPKLATINSVVRKTVEKVAVNIVD